MMKKALWIMLVMVFSFAGMTPEITAKQHGELQFSLHAVSMAYAAEGDDDTCTSDWRNKDEEEGAGGGEEGEEEGDGLLTQIVSYITDVIDDTSEALFQGITGHSAFMNALYAGFTLFVIFFGVAFMFGIVPLTFGQAFTRLLKMAVILAIVSPGGWTFFNDYAVEFFNNGTNELIDTVIGIAMGDNSAAERDAEGRIKPFTKMEDAVDDALSPEMMISTMTAFTTGPMGPAMGGMLGIGLVAFIQVLVKALRVYCISLIAKALLFGLAPIFISFVMFERTKHIFTGWVNQLVNYSLQPIMLFAFLAFFVVLIESAIDNILGVDICWTTVEQATGTETSNMFWRFTDENGEPTGSDFTWDGLVSCIQEGTGQCDDFPISILDILTFLILSHLAYRFSDVVVNIATEIASSTLFLDKLRSGIAELVQRSEQKQQAPPL